jgi:GxxExxY protein
MNTDDGRLSSVTRIVIGCAYRVANTLGCGFLEKVYENALAHEIRKAGLLAQQQCQIEVLYDGILVG